ncbi:MAG: phytanoyl-CoA dioxygenase family protein [Thiolinea sp.]
MSHPLSREQLRHFVRFGYVILPQAASPELIAQLREVTEAELVARKKPFELEADVQYPGSPASSDAVGGQTIRRLLHAYTRHTAYKAWAENAAVTASIKQLLGCEQVLLSPNHHNCMMTKQPAFSSETHWHRDTRYWRFSDKYLINSWLALGDEKAENGGMMILPGSHRWDVKPEALDEAQFLIEGHPANQGRLTLAKQVDLNAGDCLLFSAHCFHAAGANRTDMRKFSLVFTYHGQDTHGLPGTRSDVLPSVVVG